MQISVFADGRWPSDAQLETLRKMLIHPASVRNEALEAFGGWYMRCLYPNREQFREVFELPEVGSPQDVYRLIGDPSVCVDECAEFDTVRFKMGFLPPWRDTDIDMHFTDWHVDDPLYQDEASVSG